MTNSDPSALVTQVSDPNILGSRSYLDISPREDDDVYCIYNMRGVRRDLKRRDAKLIPDPLGIHFKNNNIHVPWDQLTNWPWIPGNQVIGDDWEYRAIPIFDLDAGTLDWILDKIHGVINEQMGVPSSIGSPMYATTFSANSWLSFLREDITYYVMPPRKMSDRGLHLLKQKVGEWLLKRSDVCSALETNGQWNHTLYLLSLAGFTPGVKYERRFQIPNQIILISTACVPLKPNEDDQAEARKLTAFAQQAMRRTAWDYIWIDLDLDDIETQVLQRQAEEAKDKGKQPEQSALEGEWGGPSDMKGEVDVNGIDESSHWGTDGVGVKVWLRRTIIYQLSNLMERGVF